MYVYIRSSLFEDLCNSLFNYFVMPRGKLISVNLLFGTNEIQTFVIKPKLRVQFKSIDRVVSILCNSSRLIGPIVHLTLCCLSYKNRKVQDFAETIH